MLAGRTAAVFKVHILKVHICKVHICKVHICKIHRFEIHRFKLHTCFQRRRRMPGRGLRLHASQRLRRR